MSLLPARLSPTERRSAREFAARIDGSLPAVGHELESLVVLAASLRPVPLSPRPQFRAELRETLVAAAAQRTVPADGPAPGAAPGPQRHRVRRGVALGAALSLIGGFGVAVASTGALPGDSLYGVKRALESAQLRLAHSQLARGRDLLEQADHRLSEAEALAAAEDARSAGTRARIAQALDDLTVATRAGVDTLDAAYADTGSTEPLLLLDRFAVDQRERLADLAGLLDPGLRDRVRVLDDLLGQVRTRVEALLQATSGPAAAALAGPSDTGRALALARDAGDGWAVSRLLSRAASAGAPAGTSGGTAGGTDAATGPLGDLGNQVAGTVGTLTGGSGSADSTADTPVPLPSLSVPPILGGSATPSPGSTGLPLPSATDLPLPEVSLSPLPCVPLPPVTQC